MSNNQTSATSSGIRESAMSFLLGKPLPGELRGSPSVFQAESFDRKCPRSQANGFDCSINGKSAIDWIMERYQIKMDKASGITNDPNNWSDEVGDPRYILDLLLSIVNVSVQTVDIVESLPKVKFE